MNYLEKMFGLRDKTAVITGGSGVLAGYMAEALLAAGAKVSLWGRTLNTLEEAKAKIVKSGADPDSIHLMQVNCGDPEASKNAIDEMVKDFAYPNILINNAGGNKEKAPFVDADLNKFREIIDLNLVAGWFIPSQVFARRWITDRTKACMINLSSMSAFRPLSGVWAYNAAKSGVKNLTIGLAKELAPYNIRVNAISPGFFVGKQNHDLLIARDEPLELTARGKAIISRTPMGRFGNFEDLKGAVIFLCSDTAAGFITGHDVSVDGGYLTDNI